MVLQKSLRTTKDTHIWQYHCTAGCGSGEDVELEQRRLLMLTIYEVSVPLRRSSIGHPQAEELVLARLISVDN